MIVQLLPALRQSVLPLPQHVADTVLDRRGVVRIGDRACSGIDQSQALIKFGQQYDAAVETAFDRPLAQMSKFESL